MKLRSRVILSGVLAAALLTIGPAAWLPRALTEAGNFTVRGSKIYDPSGRVLIPKGTNLNGYNSVWPQSTLASLDTVVGCWKYNTIRIGYNLYPVQWRGKTVPQYSTNNDIDAIVRAYTHRGVIVMIVFGDQKGFTKTGDPLINRHIQELARRYKNNPYVWFDLYNEAWLEPIDRLSAQNLTRWIDAYRHRIELVRSQGNNNIVLVQGAAAGQDRGRWDAKESYSGSAILQGFDQVRSGYSNVVASIHVYDQWAQGEHLLRQYFQRVHAKNISMIVGEVGVDTQRGGRGSTKGAAALYRSAAATGVGILSWGYPGGNDHVLTKGKKGSGDAINSCTHPTNLTPLGQLSWTFSHTHAAFHPKPVDKLASPRVNSSAATAPTASSSSQPSPHKPDLVITAIAPTRRFQAGDTVRLTVTVRNQGSAAATGWIGTVLAANGRYIGWAGKTTTLLSGASDIFETAYPWWKAPSNRVTLRARIDDKNRFNESNEDNNQFSVDLAPQRVD